MKTIATLASWKLAKLLGLCVLLNVLVYAELDARPSAVCDVNSLVSTSLEVVPGNGSGIQVGDNVKVVYRIQNVTSNTLTGISTQFEDFSGIQKTAELNVPFFGGTVLGRNLMITGVSYSHGQLYKLSGSSPGKTAATEAELKIDNGNYDFPEGNAGFLWVIDDLFRNGTLMPGETATITFETVAVLPTILYSKSVANGATLNAPGGNINATITIENQDLGGSCSDTETASAEITDAAENPFTVPLLVTSYSSVQGDVQPGETMFIQFNLLNTTDRTLEIDIDFLLRRGFHPIAGAESFYAAQFSPPGTGDIFYNGLFSDFTNLYQPKYGMAAKQTTSSANNAEIESLDGGTFLSYAGVSFFSPTGEFQWDSYEGMPDVTLPPGLSSFWVQGIALLEENGNNIEYSGSATVVGLYDGYDAKQTADDDSPIGHSTSFNGSVPVGEVQLIKTISDDCVDEGSNITYTLSVVGADLRKVPSYIEIRDSFPSLIDVYNAESNFLHPADPESLYYILVENAYIVPGVNAEFLYQMYNESVVVNPYEYKQVADPQINAPGVQREDLYQYESAYTFKFRAHVANEIDKNTLLSNAATLRAYTFYVDEGYGLVGKSAAQTISGASSFEEFTVLGSAEELYEYIPDNNTTYSMDVTNEATINCAIWGIVGHKYDDLNGNGVRDEGEPGVAGWSITIQGGRDSETLTMETDANGYYAFTELYPGVWSVREAFREGWGQSAPGGEGFHVVNLGGRNTTATADFGNFFYATISGTKYLDRNGSARMDEGEPGMEGVEIRLLNLRGEVVATQTTDEDGWYQFAGVRPGHYAVWETIPEGYQQTQPGPAEGGHYLVVVTSGAMIEDKDFGNYLPGRIVGEVVFDLSPAKLGNGDLASGDLSSLRVTARRRTDVYKGAAKLAELSTQVDEEGNFVFDNLVPGIYEVELEQPPYWTVTTQNPVEVDVPSGEVAVALFAVKYDDFGAPEVSTGSILGTVYGDADGSGTWQHPAEPGLIGRTVTLHGRSGRGAEISRTVVTDAQGRYAFEGLPAGVYTVRLTAESGISAGYPSDGHTVVLDEDEQVGGWATAGPGGPGWLSAAMPGDDAAFAAARLVLDTDLDGRGDLLLNLSGSSHSRLGGITGQSERPFWLQGMALAGFDAQGVLVRVTTPGLVAGEGDLRGTGAVAEHAFASGLRVELAGADMTTTDPLIYAGGADRWPVRHSTAVYNAGPVDLLDPFGRVVARVVYVQVTPMYGVDLGAERADYGDAPESYGTLRNESSFEVTASGLVFPHDGARHLLPFEGSPTLTLGTGVTADLDGRPSAQADADTDDGVVLPAAVAPGGIFTIEVSVVGEGFLSVWADVDRDGVFSDFEQLRADVPVTTGSIVHQVPVDLQAPEGVFFVRFRLSSQAGLGPVGLAPDGEVEDYILRVDASLAGGGSGLPTDDRDSGADRPSEYALGNNYPNPFNPTTVVPYELAGDGRVRLAVYDVAGRMVATLVDAVQSAGRYNVSFEAKGLPSGVYVVRLEAGGQVMTRKLTLLK